MSIQKLDYFARQSALPEIGRSGLQRLQSAKIAVVGTGGVGSAAAYFLASLGLGQLTLIDQDIVEETNLHRLLGFDQGDLHRPKAEVLSRKIDLSHPWTRTEAIVETLRLENCNELLDGTDLIVDGIETSGQDTSSTSFLWGTTLPISSPARSRTRVICLCSILRGPRASSASCL